MFVAAVVVSVDLLVDDLVFEVDCDDGTDSTNFSFTVDIMVH